MPGCLVLTDGFILHRGVLFWECGLGKVCAFGKCDVDPSAYPGH